MSEVKVEDLSPAPFLARFLEDQCARPLTAEEMKAVRGGSLVVNKVMADPPDWMGGWPHLPPGLPSYPPVHHPPGGPAGPCGPAQETTMAFPSDTAVMPQ